MRISLTIVLLMGSGGCATAPLASTLTTSAPSELVLQLSPASFGRSASLTQRITVSTSDRVQTVDALLEVDPTMVRVAFVSLAQTVGTLTWDGNSLDAQTSVHLPEALTPARILTDLQLVWWPVAAVKRELPAVFTLDADASRRVLSKAGVPIATVSFEGTGSRLKALLTHHGRYRLEIDSTEESL